MARNTQQTLPFSGDEREPAAPAEQLPPISRSCGTAGQHGPMGPRSQRSFDFAAETITSSEPTVSPRRGEPLTPGDEPTDLHQLNFSFGMMDRGETPIVSSPSTEPEITDPFRPAGEGQFRFPFMKLPSLPLISAAEVRKVVSSMVQDFSLQGLDLSRYQLRPDQYALAIRVLRHRDPEYALLLDAGTGSGKTIIFLLHALSQREQGRQEGAPPSSFSLNAGESVATGRSVLVIPRVNLAKQSKEMIATFSRSGALSVANYTGRNHRVGREIGYASATDVTVISLGVLENDFDLFNWEGVSTVYFDECQLMQRKSGEIPLVTQLRAEYPKIQVVLMSGTPAQNEEKLRVMRYHLGPHHLLKLLTLRELEEALVREDPESAQVAEYRARRPDAERESFRIRTQRQLSPLVNALRLEVVRCMSELESPLQQRRLFEVPSQSDLWIPSYQERERARRIALSGCDEESERSRFLYSVANETNKWANHYTRAVFLGQFAFMENFFYRYAQRFVQPGLHLPEIEGRGKPLAQRGRLDGADTRILGRESILELLGPLAKGTPYEVLLNREAWEKGEGNRWDAIMELSAEGCFRQLDTARVTHCTEERRSYLRKLDSLKRAPSGNTAKARIFFDEALRFMAARELSDSLKFEATCELIDRNFEQLREGRSFIFTTHTRHADFLAEALELRFGRSGLAPISIHGRTPHRKRDQYREEFKSGRYNLWCTTMDYAGTGIDVPNATMGLVYSIGSSEPNKLRQAIGRVLERAHTKSFVYMLASVGTVESNFYSKAIAMSEVLRECILSQAEVVLPSFLVE